MTGSLTILQVAEVFVITVVAAVLVGYLRGYGRRKGENVAAIADGATLTREIEQVRHEYAELPQAMRASLDMRGQLRMAVAETRLAKHQEAYGIRKFGFGSAQLGTVAPNLSCGRGGLTMSRSLVSWTPSG